LIASDLLSDGAHSHLRLVVVIYHSPNLSHLHSLLVTIPDFPPGCWHEYWQGAGMGGHPCRPALGTPSPSAASLAAIISRDLFAYAKKELQMFCQGFQGR